MGTHKVADLFGRMKFCAIDEQDQRLLTRLNQLLQELVVGQRGCCSI